MIKTFRSKPLKRFWEAGDASGLSVPNAVRVRRLLLALDAASKPEDMNLPGMYFHQLMGKPLRYSIRVSGNWRVTWAWDADAIDIDLEDYH